MFIRASPDSRSLVIVARRYVFSLRNVLNDRSHSAEAIGNVHKMRSNCLVDLDPHLATFAANRVASAHHVHVVCRFESEATKGAGSHVQRRLVYTKFCNCKHKVILYRFHFVFSKISFFQSGGIKGGF